MTSLFATRRRVEDFARHVEEQRPSHDPNLAPLLELVALFRPAAVEPSPAFCSALRGQLMAVAAELPAPDPVEPPKRPAPKRPPRTGRRRRRATVAAVAGIAAASTAFAVAAVAQDALPGDALYPVKTRLEGAQVAVTTNPESRGRQQLGISEHRLAEVRALVTTPTTPDREQNRTALVESTLRSFTEQAEEGGKLLVQAHQDGGEASLDRLREFTAESTSQLAAIEPMLSDQVRPAYDDAIGALDGLEVELNRLCLTCLEDGGAPLGPNQRSPDDPRSPVPTTGDERPTDKADRKHRDRPATPEPTNPGPVPPTTDPWSPSPSDPDRLPLPTQLPLPTGFPLPLGDSLTNALPTVPLVQDIPLRWPTALPLPLPMPGLTAPDGPADQSPQQPKRTPGPTTAPTGTPNPTANPTTGPTKSPTTGTSTPAPDGSTKLRLPFGLEIGF